MKKITLLCFAFLWNILCINTAWADATSFNPLEVSVQAKAVGGVPVGTVISWPVASNPEDWENWLECNGQAISAAVYPELFATIGAKVPDLRGLFLRGTGGNAAALGKKQGDGISSAQEMEFKINAGEANISAEAEYSETVVESQAYGDGDQIGFERIVSRPSHRALVTQVNTHYRHGNKGSWTWEPVTGTTTTIKATIGSDSPETRPVNQAVRYLMRARP